MPIKPKITISKEDYENLHALLEEMPTSNEAELLIDELERAKIVKRKKLASNIVAMHSTVTFTVTSTNKAFTLKLVYPNEASACENLSILSPVGSALIGLSVGQEIEWPLGRSKTTKVLIHEIVQAADS